MKIRLDYVSNSSSSSFAVVGKCFDAGEVVEFAKKHGMEMNEDEDDCESWEAEEFLEEKFPELSFNRGIENYYECWCVGLTYSDMKDDETKRDFEDRIKAQLKELTGKECNVASLVDGGRDS